MKVLNLEQRGPDWYKWRQEGLGGSDVSALSGNGFQSEEELALVKLGLLEVEENERMRRGTLLEPRARAVYEALLGVQAPPLCCVHEEYPWMRASLDGWTEDEKTVLEIKCPSDNAHRKALGGQYPHYYKDQLQHNLLVTAGRRLHYFSFTDSPTFSLRDRFALVEVLPDEEYQAKLFARERNFMERIGRLPVDG